MRYLKNLNLELEAINGHKLRGSNFYGSILKYRAETLAKFKHRIKGSDSHICPLCGHQVSQVLLEWESRYQLRECTSCGAASPNIDFEDADDHLSTVYESEEYSSKFMREIHKQFEYRKKTFGKKRYEYVLGKFDKRNKPKVLDVGCGAGYFLSVLNDYSIEYKGLEVSRHLVEYCRDVQKLNVDNARLEDEEDESYDVITMFDVLEHLTHPIQTMVDVNKKLAKNGICIAYTPNIHSFGYELMGAKQNTLLPFEHLCFYSENSFSYLAEKTGFRIKSIETYGLDLMDYFMEKEYEHNDSFVEKFGDMITLLQSYIDYQGHANHYRVVFEKL